MNGGMPSTETLKPLTKPDQAAEQHRAEHADQHRQPQ